MANRITLSLIANEARLSLKIALPIIAFEIIFALSGFFATVMIAHLGNESLAAHSLVWNIYQTVLLFVIGILFSVSILISQSFGAKDHHSIKICFTQGLLLAIIASPLAMLLVWFSPMVLAYTNQDPIIIELATPALRALIWTILPLNIMTVAHHFFMGINRAYLVTILSMLSVPLEIFFFYAFIFGKFGFPKLGLTSIGWGLTATYCSLVLPLLFYIYSSKAFKIYRLFKDLWQIHFKILLELIRLGLPLGIMFSLEIGLFASVAIIMGQLGTNILAAYQISYQYLMISIVILFALIQATTVRVGIEVGKNNRASLRLATAINLALGIILMLGFSFTYFYLPELVISLDLDITAPNTQEVVTEASKFLSAVGILILIDCLRSVSTGALRGLKDIKIPLLINFIGFWCIAFPIAYLLGFHFNLGGMGIWYGIILGLTTSAIILSLRFNHISKRISLGNLVTKASKL
jgi:MATE family multidrug resistance protein